MGAYLYLEVNDLDLWQPQALIMAPPVWWFRGRLLESLPEGMKGLLTNTYSLFSLHILLDSFNS
jgi:hypothetical protein